MVPIKHVVIITKENHTFDNYSGAFPGAAGVPLPHAADRHPDQGHGHDAWLRDKGAAAVRSWRNYAEAKAPYFDHIKALQGNPWSVSDDWGGWYDHVPSPQQSRWTGGGPAGDLFESFDFTAPPRMIHEPCV